jgi:hypothetical protein
MLMDAEVLRYLESLAEGLKRGGAEGEEDSRYATSMKQIATELLHNNSGFDDMLDIKAEFIHLMVFIYRSAKSWDSKIAEQVWTSWLTDAPGVDGSRTLRKLGSLMRSARAAQDVSLSGNTNLILQQGLEIHRAFNEFVSSLLPFLINALYASQGKKTSNKIFEATYSKKLKAFHEASSVYKTEKSLTLFERILKVPFRNAIAHSDVELIRDSNIIRFGTNSSGKYAQHDIDTVEFIGLISVYSHLIHAYLAALAIIGTFEGNVPEEVEYIPEEFKKILYRINYF